MTSARQLAPLLEPQHAPPPRASQLTLRRCPPDTARQLVRLWHSRLPQTQTGPWKLAHVAHWHETAFAVALWHNPSARMLPNHWLELRRLAVAPDAPHCTASWMLAAMAKDLRNETDTLISYQDASVHTGTIYKAAGWRRVHYQSPRQRDRSTSRPGGRLYRSSINGAAPDIAGKYRWQLALTHAERHG